MSILGRLARHLARKRHVERPRMRRLAETLTEIRLLLEREVDFPREQATLAGGLADYRSLQGVRIPRLIPALSSRTITALTFERGRKVTQVGALPGKNRISVASRLAEAVLAVPALSRQKDAIFHADPHAGNLLYDKRANELVILDWALTERLSREQRKSVVLLVLMTALRDAAGMTKAIEQLCQVRSAEDGAQARTIRAHVDRLLDGLPLTKVPGPMDAMRLLDALALDGTRFPAALLMFRKAAFTLEGVVDDIAGHRVRLDSVVTSHAMAHWKDAASGLLRLLSPRDWMAVEWSALTFTSRVCARALTRPLRLYVGFEANAETS
jgi:ubiquinone biosynthesis protein